MEIKREIIIKNEQETESFGRALAEELKAGDVLALIGDLGTGKTALTRYIAKGLGIDERITSPTFTIVKEYTEGRLPLYHFDVYRVSDEDELFNIGIEEYFFGSGICIVEWADMILDILPENAKFIYLEYGYKCTFEPLKPREKKDRPRFFHAKKTAKMP